jgi:hypothetical protein
MMPDLAVVDRRGTLRVLVEVAVVRRVSSEWAEKTAEAILEINPFARADFLLLATPDRFISWRLDDCGRLNAASRRELEVGRRLSAYFERLGAAPSEVSPSLLELAVASTIQEWLDAASSAGLDPDVRQWLDESGLDAAARGGQVLLEPRDERVS